MNVTHNEENQSESFHVYSSLQLEKPHKHHFDWPTQWWAWTFLSLKWNCLSQHPVITETSDPLIHLWVPWVRGHIWIISVIPVSGTVNICWWKEDRNATQPHGREMIVSLCVMPLQCIEPSPTLTLTSFPSSITLGGTTTTATQWRANQIIALFTQRNWQISETNICSTHVSWFLFWIIRSSFP